MISSQKRKLELKYGVLLINVGSPEQLSIPYLKKFLKRFLSDKRVIEIHPIIWKIILYTFILPVRSRKVLKKYKKIWKESDISPLLLYSNHFADQLNDFFQAMDQTKEFNIQIAMNYSAPTINQAMEKLAQLNISRIIVLPLFPQYSATTTAASLDQVWHYLLKKRHQISVTTINHFYDYPPFIQALTSHIKDYWQQHGKGDRLLLSYHGIPIRYVMKGDPYFKQCQATTKALQHGLQLEDEKIIMGFQSRFGFTKWLNPYTDVLLNTLPKKGIKNLDVFSPNFVFDCLETIEELAINGKNRFLQAGGKQFNFIPCLNNDPYFVEAIANLISQQ
mgnify:CR=1 FL=1|jgi:ferrochelatase